MKKSEFWNGFEDFGNFRQKKKKYLVAIFYWKHSKNTQKVWPIFLFLLIS